MVPRVELAGHGGFDLGVNQFEEVVLAEVRPQLRQVLRQVLLAQAVGVKSRCGLLHGFGAAAHQRAHGFLVEQVRVARHWQVLPPHRRIQFQVSMEFPTEPVHPGLRGVLPQPLGEARERQEAVGHVRRVDAGGEADVGQEAPLLGVPYPRVQYVTECHEVSGVSAPVQQLAVHRLLGNGMEIVLLHQEPHDAVVDEEEVQAVSELHPPAVRGGQQLLAGVERAHHDALILAHFVKLLLHVHVLHAGLLVLWRQCEHLQLVQHHAHVAAAGLGKCLEGVGLHLQALLPGDLRAALRHGVLGRANELEVVAAVGEAPNLRAARVVADADDRVPGLLDHLDEGGVAPPVAAAHAVHLVHDDDRPLGERRHLLLAEAAREVDGHVVRDALGHLIDDRLPPRVGGVVLHELVLVVAAGHEAAGGGLANARGAADEASPGVDVLNHGLPGAPRLGLGRLLLRLAL
mmetsp:Transcript_10577/g.28701  ORF Transcript_10577/g.28701 Transcript_10577/m.28701 type:complete len:460 (-) Transcript_10577:171-1550(-)